MRRRKGFGNFCGQSRVSPFGFRCVSFASLLLCALALNSKMSKTLFEKIIAREIPANIVFEDDQVIAFRDINPQAPTHVVIIPKKPIPRLAEAGPEDHQVLGHLLLKAAEVAEN